MCDGQIVTHEEVERMYREEGYTLLTRYKNSNTKVKYRCPEGHERWAVASSFKQGHRCLHCAGKIVTQEQVEELFVKQGYKTLSKYQNSKTPIEFICPENHRHKITYTSFKQGQRCAYCAEYGFNPDKPGTLYYIAFYHPEHLDEFGNIAPLYKIGVTNRTVQERFEREPTPYRIIHTESYLFGFLAYEKEQRILAQHAAHKYTGANLLVSGNTELFTTDILNLDKDAHKQSPSHDRRSA
jgi:hypothetical protein